MEGTKGAALAKLLRYRLMRGLRWFQRFCQVVIMNHRHLFGGSFAFRGTAGTNENTLHCSLKVHIVALGYGYNQLQQSLHSNEQMTLKYIQPYLYKNPQQRHDAYPNIYTSTHKLVIRQRKRKIKQITAHIDLDDVHTHVAVAPCPLHLSDL